MSNQKEEEEITTTRIPKKEYVERYFEYLINRYKLGEVRDPQFISQTLFIQDIILDVSFVPPPYYKFRLNKKNRYFVYLSLKQLPIISQPVNLITDPIDFMNEYGDNSLFTTVYDLDVIAILRGKIPYPPLPPPPPIPPPSIEVITDAEAEADAVEDLSKSITNLNLSSVNI